MSLNFLELLPEVLEIIFNYCSAAELQNLSCCCSSLYDQLLKLLWSTVKIPLYCLYNKNFTCAKKKELQNLRFTRILRLCEGRLLMNVSNENTREICTNYCRILEHCNSDILDTLSINELRINVHCINLTDQLLGNVERFTLSGRKAIRSRAFGIIAKFHNLVELSFAPGTRIDDNALDLFCEGLVSLRSLDISRTKVSDNGLSHLLKLKSLEDLNIYGNCIGDLGLSYIGELLTLKKLTAGSCKRITDLGISYLHNLSLLQDINLHSNSGLTDTAALELSKLSNLENINLGFTNISDEGLQDVSKLEFLVELDISYIEVTDEGILYLSKLFCLRILRLCFSSITDGALFHLKSLFMLKELSLYVCYLVTDLGISYLTCLQSLEVLDIRATKVTSDGLKCLVSLERLRSLRCNERIITAAVSSLFSHVQIQ